jgi:hypothetical protein
VRDFCIAFSKAVARRNAHTRRFFTHALEKALAAGDWPTIDGCRDRLAAMDRHTAAGMAVRAHESQMPDELPSVFLLAQEGKHGRSPGLEAVKTAAGDVLRDPEAVQQEIFQYFGALFNGRHVATAADPVPVDSGQPFEPSRPEAAAAFLGGLPRLPADVSARLDRPFTLPELKAAVASAAANKSTGLDGLSYKLYALREILLNL